MQGDSVIQTLVLICQEENRDTDQLDLSMDMLDVFNRKSDL